MGYKHGSMLHAAGGGKGGTRSSVLDHRFGAGPPLTVGVEEEYMLVDPESFDLVSGVEPLLEKAAESEFADRLKPELMQCVLESGTVVCEDVPAAEADLRHIRALRRRARPGVGDAPRRLRHASLLALRAPEDHRPRPVPGARRDAPVRRPARARLRHARPRGGADARGVPGGHGGRPHRAPGAARALGQLAVLARASARAWPRPGR